MDKSHLALLLFGILINFSHISAEVAKTATAKTVLPNIRNKNFSEIFGTERREHSRILNGIVSKDEDYGYHVTVMKLVNGQPNLLCGGAIIASRYILTAAHCVVDYTSDQLVVRSGRPVGPSATQPHRNQQTFRSVLKIMIPKQYSKLPCRKHQHDIAILKIQQDFDLSDVQRFRKANLPDCDSDFEDLSAVLTGYGAEIRPSKDQQLPRVGDHNLQFPKELRSIPVRVISNESCQNLADVIITESSICSRPEDENMQPCFKDDGGPLVHRGTVIGILSSFKCDNTNPDIFTKVSYYLHFIKNVLKHRSSADILTF